MTLPPNKIGYHGQRYEYWVTREMDDDLRIGWGENLDVSQLQTAADAHPQWIKAYAKDLRPTDKKIRVTINLMSCVPVTSNDGGYIGRHCLLCDAQGWTNQSRAGYNFSTKTTRMGNELVHQEDCPLNEHISDKGDLIP